jgi:hypothetical protein
LGSARRSLRSACCSAICSVSRTRMFCKRMSSGSARQFLWENGFRNAFGAIR